MSVINQTDKVYGAGNGITTTFSFDFKIFDATQILSYLINTTTLVVTGPQVLNTDYTISINPVTEGGTITYTVAPATGYNWFVKRLVPYQQEAVIPTEGPLPGLQISNQLDLMTMMVIQDQESVSRSFQLGLTSTFVGPVYMADPVDGTIQQYSAALGAYVNVVVAGGALLPSPAGGGYVYSNGTAYVLQTSISVAGTVNGTALTNLPGIPAGAGLVPIANLPVGTTANKVVQLTAAAKLPAVDGSLLTNIIPAANLNLNGNQLGVWASKSGSTVYQAATDGFIVATFLGSASGSSIEVITDSSSMPTTIRATQDCAQAYSPNGTAMVPVRKGDYWQVNFVNGGTPVLFWIPMGS